MQSNNQQPSTTERQWSRGFVTIRLTKGRAQRLRQVAALYNRETGPKEAIDLAVDIALSANEDQADSAGQADLADRMDRLEARMERIAPRLEQIGDDVGLFARSLRDLHDLMRSVAAEEELPAESDARGVADFGVWLERRLAECSPSVTVNVARLEAAIVSRRPVGGGTEVVMTARLLAAQGRAVDAELPPVEVMTVRSGRGPFDSIRLGERLAIDCHRQPGGWRLVASRRNAATGKWDEPCGEHQHKVG